MLMIIFLTVSYCIFMCTLPINGSSKVVTRMAKFVEEFGKKLGDEEMVSYFGIMYLMKKHWHCENIDKNLFAEHEQKQCKEHRKYLDIIYAYYYRLLYAPAEDTSVEEPNIHLKSDSCELLSYWSLSKLNLISKFYFDEEYGKKFHYKLDEFEKEEDLLESQEELDVVHIGEEFDKLMEACAIKLKKMAENAETVAQNPILQETPFLKH